jgi:hypothetical protein
MKNICHGGKQLIAGMFFKNILTRNMRTTLAVARAAAEVKLLQEPSLAKLRAIAKMQHIHPALMLMARAVNMPALNFAARASFKHSTRPLLYDHTLIISITCRKMYPIIARSSTIKAPVIRIFICWPFPIALPV